MKPSLASTPFAVQALHTRKAGDGIYRDTRSPGAYGGADESPRSWPEFFDALDASRSKKHDLGYVTYRRFARRK